MSGRFGSTLKQSRWFGEHDGSSNERCTMPNSVTQSPTRHAMHWVLQPSRWVQGPPSQAL